jgi:hypothetical protein
VAITTAPASSVAPIFERIRGRNRVLCFDSSGDEAQLVLQRDYQLRYVEGVLGAVSEDRREIVVRVEARQIDPNVVFQKTP